MNLVTRFSIIPLILFLVVRTGPAFGETEKKLCINAIAAERAVSETTVSAGNYKCSNRSYECTDDSMYCSCIRDFIGEFDFTYPCRCFYDDLVYNERPNIPAIPPGASPPLTPKTQRPISGKRSKHGKEGRLQYVKRDDLADATFSPRYEPKDVSDNAQDPKLNMAVPEIIRQSGFECTEYNVTTKDGYKLTLFRISRTDCAVQTTAPPVFFQHGFLGSSADWLMVDKSLALPFKAASFGLDVWLGNSRGTVYSRRHRTLSTKSKKYWDFSFHEMGIYDLPAAFDLILKTKRVVDSKTKKSQLAYVGHSMGTTMFYVCMSINTSYNDNIRTAIHLSPAAYLYHTTSPARLLLPLVKQYQAFPINGPILPESITAFMHLADPQLCNIKAFNNESLCDNLIFFIAGGNKLDSNTTVLKTVLGHFPTQTAIKVLIHFLQMVGSDSFRQFDYGPVKNFVKYNQWVPPKYNLFRVNTASLNIYGENDILIDRVDAERTTLEQGTENDKKEFLVYDYNHIDFIWGNSAAFSVAQEVLDHLNNNKVI